MSKATYYVLAKSLWQGDTFSPIAGGFSSKQEAEKVANEKSDNGFNSHGLQNLSFVVNTIVVSTTTMKRVYGWTKERAIEEIYRIQEVERYQQEQLAQVEAYEQSFDVDYVNDEDWSAY